MKTPEPSMKAPWVGKDRCHAASKLIYVTHWKISDLHRTSSSSLHVVPVSMGIWFSRGWFGLGVFRGCALGRVLEKGQTKSCTQRTPKSDRIMAHSEGRNWKSINKHSTNISGHLLVYALCSRPESTTSKPFEGHFLVSVGWEQAKTPVTPSISFVADESDSSAILYNFPSEILACESLPIVLVFHDLFGFLFSFLSQRLVTKPSSDFSRW